MLDILESEKRPLEKARPQLDDARALV